MDVLCDPYVVRFHPDMTKAHNEGRKCCTTRRHTIGEVGQVFVDENLPGVQFRIVQILEAPLEVIARVFDLQEGFDSPDAFKQFWRDTHDGKFDEKMACYVHTYAPVLDREMVLNRGGHNE